MLSRSTSRRFPPRLRVRRRGQFLRIGRLGQRLHGEHFLLLAVASHEPGAPTRLGITVTRKVGGAVARNRIKRCVREAFRCCHGDLPSGYDCVVIAKPSAAKLACLAVAAELQSLLGRMR